MVSRGGGAIWLYVFAVRRPHITNMEKLVRYAIILSFVDRGLLVAVSFTLRYYFVFRYMDFTLPSQSLHKFDPERNIQRNLCIDFLL
jgi:hypothetical protein